MQGFNRVIFGGRLTDKPRIGTASNGISYAEFMVEHTREWTFQGQVRSEKTSLPCMAWHKVAESLKNAKGVEAVLIDGRLHNRKWYNQDGSVASKTVLIPDTLWLWTSDGVIETREDKRGPEPENA